MIIRSLAIENFKCIGDEIRFSIKPITLLFGANSCGKSTLIQAIHYAREIFLHENIDVDITESGGDVFNLGGFKSFVHNHDISREIGIRFDLDLTEIDLSDYILDSEIESRSEISDWENRAMELVSKVNSGWVKIVIAWNKWLDRPIVKFYEVGLNNHIFAKIVADDEYRQFELIVFKNNVLPYNQFLIDHFDLFEKFMVPSARNVNEDNSLETNINFPHDDLTEDWTRDIDNYEPDYFESDYEEQEDGLDDEQSDPDSSDSNPSIDLPLSISLQIKQSTVLPDRNANILVLDPEWQTGDYETDQFYKTTINALVKGPGIVLTELLTQFRYLGPLRDIPSRLYSPVLSKNESRWASGIAAWDVLNFSPPEFIDKINTWLSGSENLNAGYKVEVKQFKEIDISDPISLAMLRGNLLDEIHADQHYGKIPIKSRLYLREESTNLELYPNDVGIGISQVLPVIVSALYTQRGIIAVEQPELHIHPAFQVALGDVFISQVQDRDLYFLLETHSEHLILRFLRRIRETNEGSLPPGKLPINPDQIAVYYIEHRQDGIIVNALRIDETGEFIDSWPKGFFEERERELL